MSNFAFLQELLNSVADQSRSLLPKSLFGEDPEKSLQELIKALMSVRGEASGVAIAHQLLRHYRILEPEVQLAFFGYLAETLKPDPNAVTQAATAYINEPTADNLSMLQHSVDSPVQEFFRRLNMAPGGTAQIVAMRDDLLKFIQEAPDRDDLKSIDRDVGHLLQSWFNRGFLVLRRIDWNTPASILDKIIAYEAVHEISGWDDLRRRLDPADRRCFGFFHPSLVDEPLIFVEVALTNEISGDIAGVLGMEPRDADSEKPPTTAVFYSISNCQTGLRGISFGNFLIKQVVEELMRECPSLKTFVTLSPAPGFARWIASLAESPSDTRLDDRSRAAVTALRAGDWIDDPAASQSLAPSVQALAAMYYLNERNSHSKPLDPVARFHLGNGARLERINWPADLSPRGLKQAHGLMVNYLYDLGHIERNHEAYANTGTVAASRAVRSLIKTRVWSRDPATTDQPATAAEQIAEADPAKLEPPDKPTVATTE